MIKTVNIREILRNIGISLIIVGVPYGMYLNFFVPIIRWSPIMMFLSFVLTLNYRNCFRLHFPLRARMFTIIVAFQLIMIAYGVVSGNGRMTSQYLSFHLYIIAICVALASNNPYYVNFHNFLYVLSWPLSIFGAIACYIGLVGTDEAWRIKQTDETFSIESFTMTTGVLVNIFSGLILSKKNLILKIFFVLSMIIGLYVLLICDKRTPLFVLVLGSCLYLYKVGYLKNVHTIGKYVFPLVFLLIIIYVSIPFVNEKVNYMVENFIRGVQVLFGNTDIQDFKGSAQGRINGRNWAINYISNNFDIFNYEFGGGYLLKWIDNPLLEAYLDMGIIGVCGYFYIIVLYPMKVLLRTSAQHKNILFAILLCLYSIVSIINSGNPYLYIKYTTVAFLCYIVTSSIKLQEIKKQKSIGKDSSLNTYISR